MFCRVILSHSSITLFHHISYILRYFVQPCRHVVRHIIPSCQFSHIIPSRHSVSSFRHVSHLLWYFVPPYRSVTSFHHIIHFMPSRQSFTLLRYVVLSCRSATSSRNVIPPRLCSFMVSFSHSVIWSLRDVAAVWQRQIYSITWLLRHCSITWLWRHCSIMWLWQCTWFHNSKVVEE